MKEKTLIVIKPDGVQRNLIGEIIKRYEEGGLKIITMKMIKVDQELLKKHYPDSMAPVLGQKSKDAGENVKDVKEFGMVILGWLRKFISSGPVVAMILEGEDAIKKAREITGFTDPAQAKKGTIRGDLGQDSILKANREKRPVCNLIHAADNPKEARKEIALWFNKKEIPE